MRFPTSRLLDFPTRYSSLLCGLRLLRDCDEFTKGGGIAHGEIREHLAVDGDTGGLQATDEPVVRHVVFAGGGIDARDPERPELPLAIFPVPRCVLHRLHAGFDCRTIPAGARSLVALRRVQDLLY